MGTGGLEREQHVLSQAQAGPLVPNSPSPRWDGHPAPAEQRTRGPREGTVVASPGTVGDEQKQRREDCVSPAGCELSVPILTRDRRSTLSPREGPRLTDSLQEMVSRYATDFLLSSFLPSSPVPGVYSQPSISVFSLTFSLRQAPSALQTSD